jgi:hypothetical protein
MEEVVLDAGKALTAIATEDLIALLRLVHRGELACPIRPAGLGEHRLLRLQDDLGFLTGLDLAATRAVLVAVIAERRS